jgi:hypothetical protein
MIAFLVEQDQAGVEARDRVIALADTFMTFIEHRTFGLSHTQAGPALVTGFEIMYSAEIDDQGAAIAAVTWEQEVWFGRDLDAEDPALMADPTMFPAPPRPEFTEGEFRTGDLSHSPQEGPHVKGRISHLDSGDVAADTDEHEPIE